MHYSNYEKIEPQKMILRDHLVFDRTALANERTLLAYLRTAVMVFATGFTLFKIFADSLAIKTAGLVSVGASLLVFIVGLANFFRLRGRLKKIYKK